MKNIRSRTNKTADERPSIVIEINGITDGTQSRLFQSNFDSSVALQLERTNQN